MTVINVAAIPGDGIGNEVVPAAVDVLRAVEEVHDGLRFEWTSFPWGCEYYLRENRMMPPDGLDQLRQFDAVFLGAVGDSRLVPDHISLWGLLIQIRRGLNLSLNVRPARRFPGVPSPLSSTEPFDFVVVRENSEGEYSDIGGTMFSGNDEIAIECSVFSRRGVATAMRHAFQIAASRNRYVASATKSNGIAHTMPFWDGVFADLSAECTEVRTRSFHVDALAAALVLRPQDFDVIVASNLFGDILTDLSSALMGSIGLGASSNIHPDRAYPPMFEPVHGSAPDIAGTGIANPIGQVWSAALMLRYFGHGDLADRVMRAVDEVLVAGCRTPDLGGKATTREMADEIARAVRSDGRA